MNLFSSNHAAINAFLLKKNSWKQNLFGAISSFCGFCLVLGIRCSSERLHVYLDVLPDNSTISCNSRFHRGYRCHPKTNINASKVYSLWKLGHVNIKSGQKKLFWKYCHLYLNEWFLENRKLSQGHWSKSPKHFRRYLKNNYYNTKFTFF